MSVTTVLVERWLKELPNPDSALGRKARDELIQHGQRRMRALCQKMFFPMLQGSAIDQDDVYQESALRLWTSTSDFHTSSVFRSETAAMAARETSALG